MRLAVLGNAGSGKSTLAARLSRELRLPLHEIDSFLWREGWVPAPEEEYEAAHRSVVASEAWILEGVGRLETIGPRLDRATHVILCDFPLWQHFWLLARRQMDWAAGSLALRPGGLREMPPTRALFETVWTVDREWMPTIRQLVATAERNAKVYRIDSFEALFDFTFP